MTERRINVNVEGQVDDPSVVGVPFPIGAGPPQKRVEGVDGWLPQVHPVALGTNDERDLELDGSGSEL